MNEKFREKIRHILFEYNKCPVCVVYDVLMKELSEVADEAYSQGYTDGKRDSELECGELLSEMAADDRID
jgi:hypothetical protein